VYSVAAAKLPAIDHTPTIRVLCNNKKKEVIDYKRKEKVFSRKKKGIKFYFSPLSFRPFSKFFLF
jgi:hypothetical protein